MILMVIESGEGHACVLCYFLCWESGALDSLSSATYLVVSPPPWANHFNSLTFAFLTLQLGFYNNWVFYNNSWFSEWSEELKEKNKGERTYEHDTNAI